MLTSPRSARAARPFLAALVAATLFGVRPTGAAALDAPDAVAAESEQSPQLVTRVYPVGPLLLSIVEPPKPEPNGDFGSYAAPVPPGNPYRTSYDDLRLVLYLVSPETWETVGLDQPIQFYRDRMIVTATPEMQRQVADLLAAMQGSQVVTVRALLVRADAAQVRQRTIIENGVTLLQGEPTDLPTVAQVRYSGFEGRAHRVSDGRSVPYPASVTPVVATGAVGYNVIYGTLETGLSLEVTPTLEPGGDRVLLDVDAQYVLVGEDDARTGGAAPAAAPEPATRPFDADLGGDAPYARLATGRDTPAPAPAPLAVDRAAVRTSLRAPTGRWVLVGSLGSSRDGRPTEQPPMHLLLRVDAE